MIGCEELQPGLNIGQSSFDCWKGRKLVASVARKMAHLSSCLWTLRTLPGGLVPIWIGIHRTESAVIKSRKSCLSLQFQQLQGIDEVQPISEHSSMVQRSFKLVKLYCIMMNLKITSQHSTLSSQDTTIHIWPDEGMSKKMESGTRLSWNAGSNGLSRVVCTEPDILGLKLPMCAAVSTLALWIYAPTLSGGTSAM